VLAAIRAGLLYFVGAFAAGFMLGALRTTLVAPRVGALAAVGLELPLMLLASWAICGAILRRWPVASGLGARLTMGATAFALLMAAELALAVWGLGRTAAQHWASYAGAAEQLGLAGQIGFGLIPLFRRRL